DVRDDGDEHPRPTERVDDGAEPVGHFRRVCRGEGGGGGAVVAGEGGGVREGFEALLALSHRVLDVGDVTGLAGGSEIRAVSVVGGVGHGRPAMSRACSRVNWPAKRALPMSAPSTPVATSVVSASMSCSPEIPPEAITGALVW